MSFSHRFRWPAKSPASRSMSSFLALLVLEKPAFAGAKCHFWRACSSDIDQPCLVQFCRMHSETGQSRGSAMGEQQFSEGLPALGIFASQLPSPLKWWQVPSFLTSEVLTPCARNGHQAKSALIQQR